MMGDAGLWDTVSSTRWGTSTDGGKCHYHHYPVSRCSCMWLIHAVQPFWGAKTSESHQVFNYVRVCGIEQNTSFLCLTFLIYRWDSWTTKKARCGRIDAFELWCWRRLLGIYPGETIIVKDISTPVFIATLFTVARTWKQPRCPWADEWIVSYVHIHNGILLVCKKEHMWVGSNEVDEPRTCYTEWSKSERVRPIPYINVYIYGI